MSTTPVYDNATPVAVTVPMPTYNGAPITPASISVTVTDETGAVGYGPVSKGLPSSGATQITVSIAAVTNTLPDGIPFALRQVITTFTDGSGNVYTDVQSYMIRSANPLIRMTNSFITMPETIVTRYQLMNLDGWDAATEDQRVAALISAYKNMLQLRYRFPIGEKWQSRIVDFYGMSVDNIFGRIYIVLADIAMYNIDDYNGWPPNFTDALKRAQMAEANVILRGDKVAYKRAQGIVSEDIGESRMQFRKIPEIQTAISRDALAQLRGFLNNSVLIARG